jgi:hypothetical protein
LEDSGWGEWSNVKEKAMKRCLGTAFPNRIWCLAILPAVFLGVAVAPVVGAGTTSKPAEVPARVIAHLPLPTPAGNQMILQKQEEKRFLYIQQASKQGYTVVEVTKPEYPSFVTPKAKANDSTAGKLEIVGENVGVAEVPDSASKTAIRSSTAATETVKILDLSDPAHPKTLQTFKNVTSILADGGHGIIYLTNDEGLWVLKHNREQFQPAKKKPNCDSYSAIAAMPPDCQ